MDLLLNMLSLAKDMNSTERELQKLNIQIKYELRKAERLLSLINNEQHDILFMLDYLKLRIKEAEQYSNKFDQLLQTDKMGIKDKIRLNLPFDQTKKQATSVIQNLKKAASDVENQVNNSSDGGMAIKKKITESKMLLSVPSLSNKEQQNQDEKLEEIYQMGPTIKEDEIVFSQKAKETIVEFTVELNAEQGLIQQIKDSGVHQTKIRITSNEKNQQKHLYTVARQNFSCVYKKIKQVTKEIDGISTKGHFHFVLKKSIAADNGDQKLRVGTVSDKKQRRSQQEGSCKQREQQQQVFFSFPEQNLDFFSAYKILVRKQDPSKSIYIFKQQQWVKVEQQQFQIMNGDQLAAFYNPKTGKPALSFKLSYQMIVNTN